MSYGEILFQTLPSTLTIWKNTNTWSLPDHAAFPLFLKVRFMIQVSDSPRPTALLSLLFLERAHSASEENVRRAARTGARFSSRSHRKENDRTVGDTPTGHRHPSKKFSAGRGSCWAVWEGGQVLGLLTGFWWGDRQGETQRGRGFGGGRRRAWNGYTEALGTLAPAPGAGGTDPAGLACLLLLITEDRTGTRTLQTNSSSSSSSSEP